MPANVPPNVRLVFDHVGRRFGRRVVFKDITGEVQTGQSVVITGPNGSGKSTLLRVVTGLLAPSAGAVNLFVDGQSLDTIARRPWIGYVAPDLTLYGELTGAENLLFFGQLKGLTLTRDDLVAALEQVGLKGRGRDYVRDYSSGMRQRLKYAFALLGRPPVLLLDEPTANLDAAGAEMVLGVVEAQKRHGLVVIGTNETHELCWGDTVIRLEGNVVQPVR